MTAAELHEVTEIERVETWRRTLLERAGYPPEAASRIAGRHDVDLHRAIRLVEQGCPPETAARILL